MALNIASTIAAASAPFKLSKLEIYAFTDIERMNASKLIPFLVVQYNPETLSTRHESVFHSRPVLSSTRPTGKWSHARGRELSVKLVFDGTGVDEFGLEPQLLTVGDRVERFLAVCYEVVGISHEAHYLTLQWGARGVFGLRGFKCRLASVETLYTAFDRDGTPLRAELSTKFIEALAPLEAKALGRLSSPDLTHRWVVRSGDTLPQLCRTIYGSPAHYLAVAQVNGLDDFRDLVPGQELIFPPFARREQR